MKIQQSIKRSTSEALFETAKTYFPGGVNSPVRAFKSVEGSPLFIKKGDGCMIWDEDDNEFIDFCCSWGPLILGHNHPAVYAKIVAALQNGASFGAPTRLENELAKLIFSSKGWDPYLENEGTLWLLHFQLTKAGTASIFNIIFNELRKTKPEFEEKHFYSIVSNFGKFSEATLTKDYSVFKNTYAVSASSKSEIEDSYSGILTELGLLTSKKTSAKNDALVIESKRRPEIPAQIILYAILENQEGDSLNFDKLYNEKNSVGSVFALNREGLMEKLEELTNLYPKEIVFKNEAGIRELQFKRKLNPIKDVLAKYYGR